MTNEICGDTLRTNVTQALPYVDRVRCGRGLIPEQVDMFVIDLFHRGVIAVAMVDAVAMIEEGRNAGSVERRSFRERPTVRTSSHCGYQSAEEGAVGKEDHAKKRPTAVR
ncbi:MAG: hypothetical protein V2B18_22370 [Pseudomonadota bacterium]